MKEITLDFERFEELIQKEQRLFQVENELFALNQAGVKDWENYPVAMGILSEIINV